MALRQCNTNLMKVLLRIDRCRNRLKGPPPPPLGTAQNLYVYRHVFEILENLRGPHRNSGARIRTSNFRTGKAAKRISHCCVLLDPNRATVSLHPIMTELQGNYLDVGVQSSVKSKCTLKQMVYNFEVVVAEPE